MKYPQDAALVSLYAVGLTASVMMFVCSGASEVVSVSGKQIVICNNHHTCKRDQQNFGPK